MSRLTRGTLIAVVAVTFLSTTAIFISHLTGTYHIPPLLLALWRDTLVSLGALLLVWIARRRLPRVDRRHIVFFLFYGLELALFNSIWTLSVVYNGASVATVLAYGSTAFTVLLARWLFRERLTLAKILAVILSLAGCALVVNAFNPGAWDTEPVGMAVGLLSGLLFALYNLAGKETARRGIDPWVAMFYSFAIASLFLLGINLFPALPGAAGSAAALVPALPPSGWALLVTLAFVPTLLGFGLLIRSMHDLPAGVANLIATLEPAETAAIAYLLLGERMTLIQIGGSLLIIFAVFIVQISENAAVRAPAVPLAKPAGVAR